MPYKIITDFDKIDENKWSKFLLNSPYTTPFQTSDFFLFFNETPNCRADLFVILEEDKIQSSCIVTIQKEKGIKALFSKRAIIYGGPIFINENPKAATALLEYVYNYLKREVIYIEVRNLKDYAIFTSMFLDEKWKYIPYLNVQLFFENKDKDELLSGMKYNRRREIKLSIKEGAYSSEAKNIKEVEELYVILNDLYQTKVKLPLPDADYFFKLFKSDIGKVFVVKHNETIIGGSFCIYYPDLMIYTLYYCGVRDYHKKIFPTHLAILAAIDFGIKNGLRGIDLMGAGQPNEEYGVRNYKAEFGGDMVEHGRFIKICNPFLFQLGKIGLAVLKKIKK
ncbi:MAG: hypothetical protein V4608_01425 [Bacteroidota bacterium]